MHIQDKMPTVDNATPGKTLAATGPEISDATTTRAAIRDNSIPEIITTHIIRETRKAKGKVNDVTAITTARIAKITIIIVLKLINGILISTLGEAILKACNKTSA